MNGLRDKAIEQVDTMYEHNASSDLVFESNGHYFDDLLARMIEQDTAMATDEGGLRHIYHTIRAYIKCQCKHICQYAEKELARILLLGCEKELGAATESVVCYVEKVKERRGREEKRRAKEQLCELLRTSIASLTAARYA